MFSRTISRFVFGLIVIIFILPPPTYAIFEIFSYSECALAVNRSYSINSNNELPLDLDGQPTERLFEGLGITYADCRTFCVGNTIFIDWNLFSTQLAPWLLPWIVLTAQLPFETRSTFFNFQALFLALGSPLLIIYLLSLTILNTRSINDECRQLKEDLKLLGQPKQTEAVKAVRVLSIESQNIPMKVVNGLDR
jgi:hypothetical protein